MAVIEVQPRGQKHREAENGNKQAGHIANGAQVKHVSGVRQSAGQVKHRGAAGIHREDARLPGLAHVEERAEQLWV